MANMVDSVRILLKAYKEELSLDQIIYILAKKNQTAIEAIKNAIPQLLSAGTIIETGENKYKIAGNEKPKYFYVFQSNYLPAETPMA